MITKLILSLLLIFAASPASAACAAQALQLNPWEGGEQFLNTPNIAHVGAPETSYDDAYAPVALIVSNLYVVVSTAPGVGESWTITFREDAADMTPSLSCTISDAGTVCVDDSNAPAFTVGGHGSIEVSPDGGTPAGATGMRISWCWSV